MEDICINNKLLSKEALLVMPFHYLWMIPILSPKLRHEMQAFLSLINLSTALHTLLNRQAREAGESSPRGD